MASILPQVPRSIASHINQVWTNRFRFRWFKFPLRFSERVLLLGMMDLVILNLALVVALNIRTDGINTLVFSLDRVSWFVLLSILWLAIGSILDIYDLARSASAFHSLWATGGASLLTGAIYSLIPYITPSFPSRRLEAILFPLLATLGIGLWRAFYAQVFVQPAFCQRALVVGAGWAGRTLAQTVVELSAISGNPYRGTGYTILGFVDDNPESLGKEIEGIPVLGDRQDLVRLAGLLHPDEVVVAISNTQTIHGELFQAILDCREMGIQVTTMASLYERMTGRVPVEHAGQDLYIVLPTDEPFAYRLYLGLRRLIDIVGALAGCAWLGFLIPWVWLANRLTSPGDLFYRQERVGKGGKIFNVIKFRSMVMDAEKETGALWARKDDPRITLVGSLLRKTRLDEVPQFWNVLRGDMSLIGPRPERPEFVCKLVQEIPFYRVRHAVRPGITGWAQVKYRYGASVEDSLTKLQHDLYYIKHQGPFLDLLILLKTVQVVLGLQGR